ncbi:hypothetical protein LY90DRAFT_666950 [Neocallimastix californiae]|jgi:cell division protein FtsB|uniref:GIT Spa2 homology (SHD) domain-containing protein n=1 Tax=Neocallimastix californiae TaxID=1754190 RepID=A0A1Y2ENR5_9FUNG|nr:hypothetical protein LY90DRAFT_666950 [Neocallimastix californiae]|eukprot:ORY72846.1 hypothetical protein LY90DRAFT_666950 [Neocallimastix californiae]
MSNDFYSPAVIKTHFLAFKEFLESQDNEPKRQRGAKEKLIKLTNQQFQELSTDVYDELIRRTYNSRDFDCLQSQSEFQPKRNEARAKLAALSHTRYRDLSQDIYNEIQRRFPNIVSEVENNIENSLEREYNVSPVDKINNNDSPKPIQGLNSSQNSVTDQQQTSNQKINLSPLDNVMANLKELTVKNENEKPNVSEASQVNEAEIAELKKANTLLKSKFDSLTEKYNTEKNRLEKELESVQETLTNRVKINEEQAVEYSKLYNNYTQLQTDIKTLRSQTEVNEKITGELRQENDNQIEKINELTKKNETLENENKSLKEEIEKLKNELKEEKEKKIEAAKTAPSPAPSQAKEQESKASPIEKEDKPETPQTPKKTPEISPTNEIRSPKGIKPVPTEPEPEKPAVRDCINPERFNHYREAVNELIEASKSENPADVLVAMKSIVITCKNITEESDEYERLNENTFTDEEQDKLIEIKNNLSVALTNLMSVTKNHATNYPNVSSSFIESAASDLSVTIVSLVRTLKEHQNRLLNQGSSPLQQPINQVNMDEFISNNKQAYNPQELKHFLEEKTDLIVQGIQSLLFKIQQSNATYEEFNGDIGRITSIVDNVINASQDTFTSPVGSYLFNDGEPILQELKMGNQRLKEMGLSMQNKSEQEIKATKPNLASASYEIAVYVRDLLELLG